MRAHPTIEDPVVEAGVNIYTHLSRVMIKRILKGHVVHADHRSVLKKGDRWKVLMGLPDTITPDYMAGISTTWNLIPVEFDKATWQHVKKPKKYAVKKFTVNGDIINVYIVDTPTYMNTKERDLYRAIP